MGLLGHVPHDGLDRFQRQSAAGLAVSRWVLRRQVRFLLGNQLSQKRSHRRAQRLLRTENLKEKGRQGDERGPERFSPFVIHVLAVLLDEIGRENTREYRIGEQIGLDMALSIRNRGHPWPPFCMVLMTQHH